MKKNSRRGFLGKIGWASLGLFACSSMPGDARGYEQDKASGLLKPKALTKGDKVAFICPAGLNYDKTVFEDIEEGIAKLGLKPHFGKSVYSKYGYFSADDKTRASEVNQMFGDDNIQGVICMRGGWGSARLFEHLDYDLIRENPKVFSGFSDITALLIAIYQQTGLATFHGLMGYSSWDDFSVDYFRKVAMEGQTPLLQNPASDNDCLTLVGGKARGRIVGGNLTVISSIIGCQYLPDWKDKILFVEDIGEEPYRIDRMLTQLKLAGVLDQIKGFVFGKCRKCAAETPERALTLEEVLENNLKSLGIPVFYGSMFGHIKQKFTLPVGVEVEMDADKCAIQLLEAAVVAT